MHINGLDVGARVEPQGGSSVVDVLQRNVDAIRAVSGVPHINHPNFGWAITAEVLRQVSNNRLFELYSGHPRVNNQGGGGVTGLEDVWDAILSSGTLVYGIAVDDAHFFKQPWNRGAARPGQAWVVVRAARLAAADVLAALERGDFYASTGVDLADVDVTEQALTVTIREDAWSKHRVRFIGEGGRILKEDASNPAVYRFTGQEMCVRAKVVESNGLVAWVQPVVRREPFRP